MKKAILAFTLGIFICSIAAARAESPYYSGKIIIENKTVAPGQSFILRVLLDNSDFDLTGLKIPLRISSSKITCSYVGFGGSIKNPEMSSYYKIDGRSIDIAYIPAVIDPLAVISTDSGMIATLYLTVAAGAPDENVTIAPVNELTPVSFGGHTIYKSKRLETTDATGQYILTPQFEGGNVNIRLSSGVDDEGGDMVPMEFALHQNYPNPFNPTTHIAFDLPARSFVSLDVYDLLGRRVATLAEGIMESGRHELDWDASGHPSGMYLYRLKTDGATQTKKMILMK